MTDLLITTRFQAGHVDNATNAAAASLAAAGLKERLLGCFVTEIGLTNQLLIFCHGVAADDLQPNSLAGHVAPEARSLLPETDQRLLRPLSPFRLKGGIDPQAVYELRIYDTLPGAAPQFVKEMTESLPDREKYSELTAWWLPVTGAQDQVLHLWKYRDLAERQEVRGATRKDVGFAAYLEQIRPLLTVMRSTIMVPVLLPVTGG